MKFLFSIFYDGIEVTLYPTPSVAESTVISFPRPIASVEFTQTTRTECFFGVDLGVYQHLYLVTLDICSEYTYQNK